MQFSLLDLQKNDTCDIINFTHLTWLVLLHYLVKVKTLNWKCNITVGYYQRKLHQTIIASSKWTRVIMCLKFTYFGYCTAMRVWDKDWWHWRPVKTLDTNLVWLWSGYHRHCKKTVARPSKICAWWWWTLNTLNTCSDINIHLCDSPEHFMKLSMKFDACNGYFVVNL